MTDPTEQIPAPSAMESTTNPALTVHRLSKSFEADKPLLQNLELQLSAGQRLSIRGKSGCGKSTLLRIVAGLESADSGEIVIGGTIAMKDGRQLLQPWQRQVQMVFQDLGLWPTRTVLQNVSDPLRAAGMGKSEAKERATRALQQLGLQDHQNKRPATLSGGEGRRLALARALVSDPALLLLDEPFTSLDPETREHCAELLQDALQHSRAAVILVTHDPQEAERLGGDCVHMKMGGLQG